MDEIPEGSRLAAGTLLKTVRYEISGTSAGRTEGTPEGSKIVKIVF